MRLRLPVSILLIAMTTSWPAAARIGPPRVQDSPRTQSDNVAEVERLVARLKSSDEEERYHAAVMLSALGAAEHSAALRLAASDSSERVRAVAVTGLGKTGDAAFAPMLVARLTQDKSPFVRKAAAYGLGNLKTHEGTSALVGALANKDKKYEEVRGAAIIALGKYPDPAAIPDLITALGDKSEFIRARAALALGVNGSAARQAVHALTNRLASDTDNAVRRQAAIALGNIGDRAAIPALDQAQRDPDPYLSRAALDAIKKITQPNRDQ